MWLVGAAALRGTPYRVPKQWQQWPEPSAEMQEVDTSRHSVRAVLFGPEICECRLISESVEDVDNDMAPLSGRTMISFDNRVFRAGEIAFQFSVGRSAVLLLALITPESQTLFQQALLRPGIRCEREYWSGEQ